MARTAPRVKKSIYSPHPSLVMEESSIANLPKTTGKTLEQWLAIIKKSGPPTEKERREWLKKEHGFTANYASWVAERAEGRGSFADQYDPDAYVEGIFAGPKTVFRSAYEAILAFGFKLGKDVKVCPCQTIIPFYRNHVFAQVKVPNRSRLDLGYALKDTPVRGSLIDTGGFAKKDRITHRIEIVALTDFDDEAKKWMRTAYEMDA
jgi:Domain of unknown function (DUF5655)/Domain of unknown function (DUF4287)